MKKILVTGANGQLAQEIKSKIELFEEVEWFFLDKNQLNICDQLSVKEVLNYLKPDYILNTAAYTAVDLAESEIEKAYLINQKAVAILAKYAKKIDAILLHFSTDFIFDGTKKTPYQIGDVPKAINIYGDSKYRGEQEIIANMDKFFIIRSSWIYSRFRKNFYKTMKELAKKHSSIRVVNDQIGSPTYAGDIVELIAKMINTSFNQYGIYHYSNKAAVSWCDFSKEIYRQLELKTTVDGIPSEQYPSAAKRPKYTVLDSSEISEKLKIQIKPWKESLQKCIQNDLNKTK